MKELVIDKTTNISRIQNKLEYTSLVLKTKVNPKKLIGFKNIKELTLDYVDKNGKNYNEQRINELPFKDNLEKLVFKNIKNLGKGYRTVDEIKLDLPNLKSITFPSYIDLYDNSYLKQLENLEEIIFDIGHVVYFSCVIYLSSEKLKKIIIKYKYEEYIIEPDYMVAYIDDLDIEDGIIKFNYSSSNSNIESNVTINTNYSKGNVEINNIFDVTSDDGTLIIPDYVTELNGFETEKVSKIIFNLKLLNYLYSYKEILKSKYYDRLNIVEIKRDNDMALFPSIKIHVKDYGMLKDFYFDDHLLYLDYNDKTLTINSKGEINKIIKEDISISEESKDLDLKKYTLTELENYASYLRLLKLSSDKKYQEAMKVVEKEVIKKLTK